MPVIDEVLVCEREQHNIHDPFAVAVYKGSTIVGHVPRRIAAMCYAFLGKSGCSITCKVTEHRRYSHDLPQGGMEVPCHLIFHGEEVDVKKIRTLIVSLNTAQLITNIKIVDGYSKKETAELTKGVINEDPATPIKIKDPETEDPSTPIKIENPETYSSEKSGDNALVSEDTALKIENPETYNSPKSGDNALDDVNSCICATNQPQSPINSVEGMSSPHTTILISPLDLVQEVLRSPESSRESVCIVDRDNVTSYIYGATSNSQVFSASKFYGKKTSAKKSYLDLEIRRKKSREVQWVKLGKSSLSKFDRDEIDGGSRLNDRHINHAQAMIKSQFSLEGLQCTLFQNSRQPPRNEIQIIPC